MTAFPSTSSRGLPLTLLFHVSVFMVVNVHSHVCTGEYPDIPYFTLSLFLPRCPEVLCFLPSLDIHSFYLRAEILSPPALWKTSSRSFVSIVLSAATLCFFWTSPQLRLQRWVGESFEGGVSQDFNDNLLLSPTAEDLSIHLTHSSLTPSYTTREHCQTTGYPGGIYLRLM